MPGDELVMTTDGFCRPRRPCSTAVTRPRWRDGTANCHRREFRARTGTDRPHACRSTRSMARSLIRPGSAITAPRTPRWERRKSRAAERQCSGSGPGRRPPAPRALSSSATWRWTRARGKAGRRSGRRTGPITPGSTARCRRPAAAPVQRPDQHRHQRTGSRLRPSGARRQRGSPDR